MPKNTDIKKVLVIGSGPIVIGQAAEFDYAGVQACRALKEEGIEVILVNSNPATIMTDENIAEYARREKAPMLKLSQELKTMFLAADDDVIDYTVALDELEVDSLFAKPDGGHRFEKYWPEVIEEIKNIFADL